MFIMPNIICIIFFFFQKNEECYLDFFDLYFGIQSNHGNLLY